MDATHLAEFHQVEGVVADRNLTLADLIGNNALSSFFNPFLTFLVCCTGFMKVFFKKMGIEQVRFKPAYNPYTEVCESFRVSDSTMIEEFFLAVLRDFCLPPALESLGRSWKQWNVPSRNA